MSFSPRKDRIAVSIVAASVLAPRRTSSKASSAASVQCHVSSKTSIWASLSLACGPLNSTFQEAFESKGGSRWIRSTLSSAMLLRRTLRLSPQ